VKWFFCLKGTIRHRDVGSYLLATSASPLCLPKAALAAKSEMLTAPPKRLSSAR